MAVQGCVAAVWRIHAKGPIGEWTFDARWAPGSVRAEGGPSSGQGLVASTWYHGPTVVSVGAPDAEGLANYERAGLSLPITWQALVGVDDLSQVFIEEYLPDGLRLRLPELRSGEVGQVHFAVAWADAAAHEDASWFAIDVPPRHLLGLFAHEQPGTSVTG